MADRVMRMHGCSQETNSFSPPVVQRNCTYCGQEEKKLRRKEITGEATEARGETENYVSSLSGGQGLSQKERSFFEPRIGYDFSNVRLHTNAEANQSARAINALAYTHGNNIVFASNQYQPESNEGKKLLTHELTHVVQQMQDRNAPVIPAEQATRKTSLENGQILSSVSKAPPAYLHRQPAPLQTNCPLPSGDIPTLLNEPLPWKIQAADSLQQIDVKRTAMRGDPKFLDLTNKCLIQTRLISRYIGMGENVSIQDILNGVSSGQSFLVINRRLGSQVLEGWADLRPLPGSGNVLENLRYTVRGPDATTTPNVSLPGLSTAQCGDECTEAERSLTDQQFEDSNQPVRSCCSKEQCTVIHDHLAQAEKYMQRAIDRVRTGKAMDNAVKKHFGRADQNTYKDVLAGLDRILPDVQFSRHLWVCRQQSAGDMENCSSLVEAGKLIRGRTQRGGWRIALCFTGNEIEWQPILHEVVHAAFTGTTESETYLGGGTAYPPANALKNADSYASFAKEVGDPGWVEEAPATFDTKLEAGLSLNADAIKPVFGARLELTPRGPGMRLVDLVGGPGVLWAPNGGLLSPDKDSGGSEFLLGGDAAFRVRPTRSILIDAGSGIFAGHGDEGWTARVIPKISVTWKPGGEDSGFTLGADLQAVYSAAQAQPDALIFGVNIGYRRERKPERRKP